MEKYFEPGPFNFLQIRKGERMNCIGKNCLKLVFTGFLAVICNHGYGATTDSTNNVFFQDETLSAPISTRDTGTKKGNNIKVYVDGCKYSNVKFDEQERHSRIYNDFSALLGKIKSAKSVAGVTSCGPEFYTYALKYDRAQLKLTAFDSNGKETSTMNIVTGPEEHFYLGLDLPVNSRKILKYDATTKSLVPTDTNPQFYLSFNYFIGDLAATSESGVNDERHGFVSLKAFVMATSRPLDSYGLGVGYQLAKKINIRNKDWDFSAINLFAGRFWYKQDAITAAGTALFNQSTTSNWRFGLTYDLGTALGWVK